MKPRGDSVDKTAKTSNGVHADKGGVMDQGTIDQVRELLFGGTRRSIEQQIVDLDHKLDALASDMNTRFAALENRLTSSENETESKRLASLEDIGSAITALGQSISNMATVRKGR